MTEPKPHFRKTAAGDVLPAVRAADGFQNLVANLGTERDKASFGGYTITAPTEPELMAAYRSSALARKVVDLPAEDAVREWREWQAQADQITAIEAEESRLGLRRKVEQARKRARLFGGAAIYIGTGEGDPSRPLRPITVRRGGLRYLTVLNRRQLTPGEIERDPRQPGYGAPRFYTMAAGMDPTLEIHPSRLALFVGEDRMDEDMTGGADGWGDSCLTAALEKVMHLDATQANIASLVYEAKIDVIKVPDLLSNMRSQGAEYEQLLLRRFLLAATAKGINGTLLLDGDENYEQKSASFATLPDIMDRFAQMVAAAAGIPMTLLFGTSPGGLNATGESDTRGYYDRIKAEQELGVGPALELLDECLIRSALGGRPEELHYTWRPLWQPTAKERADVAKSQAETLKIGREIGAASDEALGKSFVNAMTESGAFPGLEAAAEEFPLDPVEDPVAAGMMPAQLESEPVVPATAADAAPRTLYVRRDVLNGEDIIAWAKGQGFKTTLPADDLHVTIAFSREPVDWMATGEAWAERVEVASGGARMVDQFGDARVLLFASSELSWRHEEIRRAGASWDHPEYQPHVTISYDPDAPAPADVEPYRGPIILGPEVFEEVNPKWKEGVAEE